jgi:hypothetical protein
MGNVRSKSIRIQPYVDRAKFIYPMNEGDIIKNLSTAPVVSYGLTFEVTDGQILTFEKIVDAVNNFKCLTLGKNINIFIDGEIHYQNVNDFTLVILAIQNHEIKIRTHSPDPVIVTCTGYTFSPEERTCLAFNKIKTNTSRYSHGCATKI